VGTIIASPRENGNGEEIAGKRREKRKRKTENSGRSWTETENEGDFDRKDGKDTGHEKPNSHVDSWLSKKSWVRKIRGRVGAKRK
jgi:hypothetical protein